MASGPEYNNNAPETIENRTGVEGAVNNVQNNGGTDALQCKLGEKFHPRFGCIPDSARGNGDLKGGGSMPQQGQAPSRQQNGPQGTTLDSRGQKQTITMTSGPSHYRTGSGDVRSYQTGDTLAGLNTLAGGKHYKDQQGNTRATPEGVNILPKGATALPGGQYHRDPQGNVRPYNS